MPEKDLNSQLSRSLGEDLSNAFIGFVKANPYMGQNGGASSEHMHNHSFPFLESQNIGFNITYGFLNASL